MLVCDHILVDGWNVIHAEPKLAKLLQAGGEAAQKALAELLEPVHDFCSARITIVYDGNRTDVSIQRPNNAVNTFAEVYTPSSMTADEFIERYCAFARNKSKIVVISNDNMIWETVSSFGVVCMRIGEIFSYAKVASAEIKTTTSRINFKTDRQWQSFSPLAKLDSLELEINQVKSSVFDSKKMRKKLSKISNVSLPKNIIENKSEVEAQKKAQLKQDAQNLKIRHPHKKKTSTPNIEVPQKRIPRVFKDFKELFASSNKKSKNKRKK